MEIARFEQDHIAVAADFAFRGFQAHRPLFDGLLDGGVDRAAIEKKLGSVVESNPAVVALERGHVVGHMTAYSRIPQLKGAVNGIYSPWWAHGADPSDRRGRIYHALYREASRVWCERGESSHLFTFLSSDDALRQEFYALGFGELVIDLIRSMTVGGETLDSRCSVHQAGPDDIGGLRKMDKGLHEHLSAPPVFLHQEPGGTSDAAIEEAFLSEGTLTVVAVEGGELIGAIRGRLHSTNATMLIPEEDTLGIDSGFTHPAVRDTGVGAAILNRLIRLGRQAGMTRCSVDCESMNREGSSFWLKHFRPVALSVMRRIDERMGHGSAGAEPHFVGSRVGSSVPAGRRRT